MSHSEINQLEKITGNSPEAKSLDITQQNIEQLKQLFPDVFSENKIDFDALKAVLGETVDGSTERYNFTWNGKTRARQIAQTPSTGTLRPCIEESVNWNTTENLFIEGDNLEVLKLLQKSYHKKVKMIYIDPPYNTGNDFVYKDNFHDNIKNYLEKTGQVDGSGNKLSTNSDTSGRYHSDWLSMMYPRLKLARNLLRDDGVMVIHLDEHESFHLKIMLNDIFGEDNFLGEICWDKGNPKGDSTKIAYQHESIICFAKNYDWFKSNNTLKRPKLNAEKIIKKANSLFKKIGKVAIPDDLAKLNKKYGLNIETDAFSRVFSLADANHELSAWINSQTDFSGGEAAYKFIDDEGRVYQPVSMSWPNNKKAPDDYFIPLIHPKTKKECPVPEKGWRNPSATMKELLGKGLIVFGDDENTQPRRKYLLSENMFENVPSVLKFAGSDDALFKRMGLKFDNPKPHNFSKSLISYFTEANDIVLDFFAGSGTTGHACLSFEPEQKRNFILVQLPEKVADKTIVDTTISRLKYCVNEAQGFKVLKLDETNIRPWDANFDNLELVLQQATESIKDGRSSEDVLYEIFLKYGYDLTTPVKTETVNGKTVYIVGVGALIVCLDDDITGETVEGIAKLKEELDPETTQVVFKDAGFADSNVKTNAIQILKQAGIDDVKSI
ncbi:site-specific DNA-methyltransferase [Shewanella frigidimarina]|uniref:site-specific DNA-methyltransferase n=1 Tax=Shewanella frigidimarina TaxID=56812 RepID=UPI003D7B1C22